MGEDTKRVKVREDDLKVYEKDSTWDKNGGILSFRPQKVTVKGDDTLNNLRESFFKKIRRLSVKKSEGQR